MKLKSYLMAMVFGVMAFAGFAVGAGTLESAKEKEAITKLVELSARRDGLAGGLKKGSTINFDTFKQVCAPIGMELKSWGEKMGYQVAQIARKNRNPKNALSTGQESAYSRFEKNAKLDHLLESESGRTVLYQRIQVTEGCLHCHGTKESRPAFVIEKYPQDLAFDYKVGDLRGVYRVDLGDK